MEVQSLIFKAEALLTSIGNMYEKSSYNSF